MSAKNNFKQALKELISSQNASNNNELDNSSSIYSNLSQKDVNENLNTEDLYQTYVDAQSTQQNDFFNSPSEAQIEEPTYSPEVNSFSTSQSYGDSNSQNTSTNYNLNNNFSSNSYSNESSFVSPPDINLARNAQYSTTVIADGTVIVGEIVAKGDVAMYGEIQGNVSAAGNIDLGGKIIGDVQANDMVVSNSSILGNINSRGNLIVNSGSIVAGNIAANDCSLNCKIKGNIAASGLAHIKEDMVLIGNLDVDSIVIERGARIRGQVNTGIPDDIENMFNN